MSSLSETARANRRAGDPCVFVVKVETDQTGRVPHWNSEACFSLGHHSLKSFLSIYHAAPLTRTNSRVF